MFHMQLKCFIKKSEKMTKILRYFCIPMFVFQRLIFEIGVGYRKLGFGDKKYAKLKNLKNIHVGQRCFLIATGPSLTIEDLEKLNGEYTLGMNSVVSAFDQTEWRPTYYGIQDEYVYKKLKNEIVNAKFENLIIGSPVAKYNLVPDESILFPADILNHKMPNAKYNTKFSSDCYLKVYDGYTITYSLLQVAVYMGFKEIYLVGADCTYNTEIKRFRDHGVIDRTIDTAGDRMMVAYKKAKEYCDAHDVKIYNATRGGMLEVFTRVDLDKVLSK